MFAFVLVIFALCFAFIKTATATIQINKQLTLSVPSVTPISCGVSSDRVGLAASLNAELKTQQNANLGAILKTKRTAMRSAMHTVMQCNAITKTQRQSKPNATQTAAKPKTKTQRRPKPREMQR